jgi:hypothetical protein
MLKRFCTPYLGDDDEVVRIRSQCRVDQFIRTSQFREVEGRSVDVIDTEVNCMAKHAHRLVAAPLVAGAKRSAPRQTHCTETNRIDGQLAQVPAAPASVSSSGTREVCQAGAEAVVGQNGCL